MQRKKIWICLLACILGVLLLLTTVVCTVVIRTIMLNEYTLQITLNGMRELVVECGEEYQEPGAAGKFFGSHLQRKPIDIPVSVEGTVDYNTVGEYRIVYKAAYKDHTQSSYRIVRVVDTKPPVITLVTDPDGYTFPGQTYVEEGFSAYDAGDGDLTALVQRVQTADTVTYTVSDSLGHSTTVTRQIIYDDPVLPELKLNGPKLITLNQGQTFKEPGYSATDNCDGDLTSKVTISGNIKPNNPGIYTLVYTVKDSYDNETSMNRQVIVQKKNTPVKIPADIIVPDGKVIYLTFDDGPSAHTPKLLDVLRRYKVKATFFVAKTGYVDTIKQIVQEGHSIGVHTTTHNFSQIYANTDAYFKDLYNMQKIIQDLTGQETMLMRFPGGSSNTVSKRHNRGIMTRLVSMVQQKGFRYFDWNVDSNDAGGAQYAGEVLNNVIEGVSKRQISIVLQHDTKEFSVDAVERIIIWGLSNGYTFLPLDMTSPVCYHSIRN